MADTVQGEAISFFYFIITILSVIVNFKSPSLMDSKNFKISLSAVLVSKIPVNLYFFIASDSKITSTL